MELLSPYGKNIEQELQTVYHLHSVEDVRALVMGHLMTSYGFLQVRVVSLHVAFGLAARVEADGHTYYLKFASRDMNRTPEALFPLIDFLEERDVPVPHVLPTVDGHFYRDVLTDSPYDVVYLMRAVPGEVLREASPARVDAYARVMAQYHRYGQGFESRVMGGEASRVTWADRAQDVGDLVAALERFFPVLAETTRQLLPEVAARLRAAFPEGQTLPRTHLHGDFRLCHVLYTGDEVTGLLDVDQSTWGERLTDLCYGLMSAPTPENGAFLTLAELRRFFQTYDALLPLEDTERAALVPGLLLAGLELLGDLLLFLERGVSGVTPADVQRAEQLLADLAVLQQDGLLPS